MAAAIAMSLTMYTMTLWWRAVMSIAQLSDAIGRDDDPSERARERAENVAAWAALGPEDARLHLRDLMEIWCPVSELMIAAGMRDPWDGGPGYRTERCDDEAEVQSDHHVDG